MERYQFPKPGMDDVIVTSCRTNKRAIWAAHLLTEAGYSKVFAHQSGVYGWKFSPSVKPYDSYRLGDEIPPPKQFNREVADVNAALRELEDLGLLSFSKDNSARSSPRLSPDTDHDPHALEDSTFVP